MGKYCRLNLSLNPANPLHKEALGILSTVPPRHRTEFVCRALLQQRGQDTMINQIREVIQEELKFAAITTIQPSEPQDDDAAILEFLHMLQEGGD